MKIGLYDILRKDKHVVGLPNVLTVSRLLFLPIIAYFLQKQTTQGDWLAFLFIFFAGISDFFDGFAARKLKQVSETGKMLDPLMDKMLVGIIMLLLAAYKGLPYWYVWLVILRDLLILVASLYLIKQIRNIAQSNMLGKLTLTSYLIVIMLYTIGFTPLDRWFMWASVVLIPASVINYFRVYHEHLVKRQRAAKLEKE